MFGKFIKIAKHTILKKLIRMTLTTEWYDEQFTQEQEGILIHNVSELRYKDSKRFFENFFCYFHSYDFLQGKSVLEIGSGYGGMAVYAKKHLGTGMYVGLEPDKTAVVLSKNYFALENAEVFVLNGIGENIPFKENSFDIVYCCDTLEHVMDIEKVLSESYRVLKSNGYFLAIFPPYLHPWGPHIHEFRLPYVHVLWSLEEVYTASKELGITCRIKTDDGKEFWIYQINGITIRKFKEILSKTEFKP